MEIRFSKRIPTDFTPNEISGLVEELKRNGTPFLDLTVSNPTQAGFQPEAEELRKCLSGISPGAYEPDPRGLASARTEVASWLSGGPFTADPNALWLTSGTSEAYGFLFKLFGDAGKEVAVPQPSYPLFEHLLSLEGLEARPYRLRYAEGWKLDFDSLEAVLADGARLVVVVHPNNPTGSFVNPPEMARLIRLCRERGAGLVVDEVFLSYDFLGKTRPSFLSAKTEVPIFVLDGLSKRFGLPQMKLSWIYLNAPTGLRREIEKRLDWIADAYLSLSTPVQQALPHLARVGQSVHDRIRERVCGNYRTLEQAVRGQRGVQNVSGEGGWSAVLRLDRVSDEERFVRDLLMEDRVLVQPGYFFDLPFPASVVISFLPPEPDFQEGMKRLLGRINRSG
ncbi:MAG: pyridoxal phosphate-dependent aminotransferase [Pseudomonadota bacterium]